MQNPFRLSIYFFMGLLLLGIVLIVPEGKQLAESKVFDYLEFFFFIIFYTFFYFFYGFYHSQILEKYNPDIFFWRLNEFLLTPLFYALLVYIIDKYILTKYFKKTWVRVCILFLIFLILSIPVLIWHPPLGV